MDDHGQPVHQDNEVPMSESGRTALPVIDYKAIRGHVCRCGADMTKRAREIESGEYEVKRGCDFYTAPRAEAAPAVAEVTIPQDEASKSANTPTHDHVVQDAAESFLTTTRVRGRRRR